MAGPLTLQIDPVSKARLEAYFKKLPISIGRLCALVFNERGLAFVNMMKQKHLRGGTTDTALRVRTGALRRAYHREVKKGALPIDLEMKIGFQEQVRPYASIHEYGGTITPKNSKFLAIPGPAVSNPSGVAVIKSPRAFGQGMLAWIPRTKGPGYVLIDKLSGKIAFTLVPSVRIPARMHLRDEWEKEQPKFIGAILEKIDQAMAMGYV